MKPHPISSFNDRHAAQIIEQLHPRRSSPAPLLEPSLGDESLAEGQTQTPDSAVCEIRVVSFRARLCDEDNLCEKFHIDALRYLKAIPDDSPDKCHIITTQKKVSTRKEERTEITVTFRPPQEARGDSPDPRLLGY